VMDCRVEWAKNLGRLDWIVLVEGGYFTYYLSYCWKVSLPVDLKIVIEIKLIQSFIWHTLEVMFVILSSLIILFCINKYYFVPSSSGENDILKMILLWPLFSHLKLSNLSTYYIFLFLTREHNLPLKGLRIWNHMQALMRSIYF